MYVLRGSTLSLVFSIHIKYMWSFSIIYTSCHSLHITCINWTRTWLLLARLHSSVGRASHRYRGGHGFESPWSLRIFSGLSLTNCFSCLTARITFIRIRSVSALRTGNTSESDSHIDDLYHVHISFNLIHRVPRCKWKQRSDWDGSFKSCEKGQLFESLSSFGGDSTVHICTWQYLALQVNNNFYRVL